VSDDGLCPAALIVGVQKNPPRVLFYKRVSDDGLCPAALIVGVQKNPPRVLFY
jgi:hypothetical protein